MADEGLDWKNDRSQCVLAYFKISISYDLDYDTEFCSVRNPGNILDLVQTIQSYLSEEEEANLAADAIEAEEPIIVDEIPVVIDDKEPEIEEVEDSPIQEAVIVDEKSGDAIPVVLVDEELVENVLEDAVKESEDEPVGFIDDVQLIDDDNKTQLTEAGMADQKGLFLYLKVNEYGYKNPFWVIA